MASGHHLHFVLRLAGGPASSSVTTSDAKTENRKPKHMLALLLFLSAPTSILEVAVQPIEGEVQLGNLVALASDGVTVTTPAGEKNWGTSELLRIESRNSESVNPRALEADPIALTLVGRSFVRGSQFLVERGRATIRRRAESELRVSTNAIRQVRLLPLDQQLQDQWKQIVSEELNSDVLVILKSVEKVDDDGRKSVSSVLDQLAGTIADVTPTHVTFAYAGTEIDVPRKKVAGLRYFHARLRNLGDPLCKLVDANGNTWQVKSLKLGSDKFSLVSLGGVRADIPLDAWSTIDYSVANLVFLDELEPVQADYRPYFSTARTPESVVQWFRPKMADGVLHLGQQLYERGVSLHSQTSLTYRLQREYRQFRAKVGIDDRFRNSGQVCLTITHDKRTLFEQEISGKDGTIELEIDMRGVRRFTIAVGYGKDNSDWGDQLNLCDARLVK